MSDKNLKKEVAKCIGFGMGYLMGKYNIPELPESLVKKILDSFINQDLIDSIHAAIAKDREEEKESSE